MDVLLVRGSWLLHALMCCHILSDNKCIDQNAIVDILKVNQTDCIPDNDRVNNLGNVGPDDHILIVAEEGHDG